MAQEAKDVTATTVAATTVSAPAQRSDFALSHKFTITDSPAEVFVVRFSPDGKYLAAGCGDGAIRVYTVATGKLTFNLNVESVNQLPTTSLRFRPLSSRSKTKNVLLACNADGSVDHWHITSGRRLHTITEADNQIFCVDYCCDGSKFAAAGKDYKVRIYDEATKTLRTTLAGGFGSMSPGHSNRVFSLKFKPDDENLIISGGWDNTCQIWDLRMECSVRSFYGPHIAGDAVDVLGNAVLTGSWRVDKPLQLWDFGTGKLIEDIPWTADSRIKGPPCQLYAAQFSSNGKFISAGGSSSNELRVFDRTKNNAVVGIVAGMPRAVFTVDHSADSKMVAVGGGDSSIRVYDIVARDSSKLSAQEYRASQYMDGTK